MKVRTFQGGKANGFKQSDRGNQSQGHFGGAKGKRSSFKPYVKQGSRREGSNRRGK